MARPRKPFGTHRVNVALTLDPVTVTLAKRESGSQGISLSCVVDSLLVSWLAKAEKRKLKRP